MEEGVLVKMAPSLMVAWLIFVAVAYVIAVLVAFGGYRFW